MNNHLITRLVVGGSKTLALGQPVRQALEASGEGALRWNSGAWVAPRAKRLYFPRVFRIEQPQTIVVRSAAARAGARARRRALAAGAMLAVATAVAVTVPLVLHRMRAAPIADEGLPIAHAARAPAEAAVSVVASAYVPPMPSVPAPDAQSLPIAVAATEATPVLSNPAPPQLTRPTHPPQPPQPDHQKAAEPAKPAPTAVAAHEPPVPAKVAAASRKVEPLVAQTPAKQHEQQPASAVVLDEAAHKSLHAQPASTAPAAAPPAKAPSAPAAAPASLVPAKPAAVPAALPVVIAKAPPTPVVAPAPTPAPASKPAAEQGAGLIAITPDGKLAVFTNPKTRLPQQFKIGDQLPGGDIVRSIDPKAGKVVSSTKEYIFD